MSLCGRRCYATLTRCEGMGEGWGGLLTFVCPPRPRETLPASLACGATTGVLLPSCPAVDIWCWLEVSTSQIARTSRGVVPA
jgi:hypothetical protein